MPKNFFSSNIYVGRPPLLSPFKMLESMYKFTAAFITPTTLRKLEGGAVALIFCLLVLHYFHLLSKMLGGYSLKTYSLSIQRILRLGGNST